MRFLSAPFIYTGSGSTVKNGVLVLDDSKTIDALLPDRSEVPEEKIEFFPDGVLCPGFVNTHCHLELSHMKGQISAGQNLSGFIRSILSIREKFKEEEIAEAIIAGDEEMFRNGIVAVGDISNRPDTIAVKSKSKILYHTFVEVFDLDRSRAVTTFDEGVNVLKQFRNANLRASLVPHAPYSVSPELMRMLYSFKGDFQNIISIHNQETAGEDEMFMSGTGDMLTLFRSYSPTFSDWGDRHQPSIEYTLSFLPNAVRLLLVHNTFSTSEIVKAALKKHPDLFWAICANANLYIENKFPLVAAIDGAGGRVTIGTDSYASNWSLSILDELKLISSNAPEIPFEKLIKWATFNGACLLDIENKYGSFEIGKTPGVNLLKNSNLNNQSLTKNTFVTKIC